MTVSAPGWWTVVLLALAAFRTYRLAARDTITEPIRGAVTYPDEEAVTLDHVPVDRIRVVGEVELPKPLRVYVSTLLRCPWCLGFYSSVGWWLAWSAEPRWTLWIAVPWALSGLLGLAAKLDA